MKYFFSYLFILLLEVQTFGQSKFSIGYINSLEFSNIYYNHQDQYARIAYTNGCNVRYQINSTTNITTGFQYSLKGFSSHFNFIDANNNSLGSSLITYSFKFIDVPILFSGQSNNSKKISLYTSAGLVPGYFIAGKANGLPGNRTVKIDQEDINRYYNRFIISGYLGIGGMVKLGKKFNLLIQPNYKSAMTKLDNTYTHSAFGIFPTSYHLRNYHPNSIGLLIGIFCQL